MCDTQVSQLLDLLASIEAGHSDWPRPLLIGLVCALDKCNGREDANGYRPICILSMIYRCWAGIRACQLTRHLSSLLSVEIYGFVPGRESSEVWFLLEVMIETALQSGCGLTGHSSDLVKAFNNIPRTPVFQLQQPWNTTLEYHFPCLGKAFCVASRQFAAPSALPLPVRLVFLRGAP